MILRSEVTIVSGKTVPLETAWRLAQAYFGDFMAPSFRGRDDEELECIFGNAGLNLKLWTE